MMVLVIALITASVAGIIYGIKRKNKMLTVLSIILLIAIVVLLIIYNYLYSLNPY